MILLMVLLPLAAVLKQSLGEDYSDFLSDISVEKQKEIVDRHNEIRRRVQPAARNMLKMTWSKKACESARKWAKKCPSRNSPKEERTVDGGICGENILQSSYSTSWLAVIEVWQRKESNFKYGIGTIDPRKNIYSYSQLVWYKAHQIGCALAYCPGKSYPFLYICRYCPRGIGIDHLAMPYKEGPPCEDCPYDCEDKLCTNPCRYEDRKMDCKAVISLFSCKSSFEQQCEATCKCTTEIN